MPYVVATIKVPICMYLMQAGKVILLVSSVHYSHVQV